VDLGKFSMFGQTGAPKKRTLIFLKSAENHLSNNMMKKAILCGSFYEMLQKASERKTSQTMPSCSSSVHYSTGAEQCP